MALAVEFTKPSQYQNQAGFERLNIVRPPKIVNGTLAALNAELLLDVRGEECASVYFQNTNFVGTLEFTASVDGTNFFPIPSYPYTIACVGGTLPVSGTPIVSEALAAASTRCYTIPCGQISTIRVRASAFTSGSGVCTIHADGNDALNQSAVSKPMTLHVTVTGAASAAVTATLPAVVGFRHVIDFIVVTRSATAALTASATPVVITTTNLPGAVALTLGQDAGGIGVDRELRFDAGSSGLAALATNSNTTVVCPVYTGVIWRVTVGYRLGI